MNEGKELHYGKLTLLISAIIGLIIAGLLIALGVYIYFQFGGWYTLLSALIFIISIIIVIYSISMILGFIFISKAENVMEDNNQCSRCNRIIDDNIVCPYCGKKVNKWYLKIKGNQENTKQEEEKNDCKK